MSLFSGGLDTLKSVQDEGLAGQQVTLGQQASSHIVGIFIAVGISLGVIMGITLLIFLTVQTVKEKKRQAEEDANT